MVGTRVNYIDAPGQALTVRLIHAWHRGDIPAPIMSASSGPKAYLKNDVYAIFEADSHIDAVLMVRAGGPTFFLLRRGPKYFDISRREVEIHGSLSPEG